MFLNVVLSFYQSIVTLFIYGYRLDPVTADLVDNVKDVLRGIHLCVFAYGQTGTGKTYTMEGNKGEDNGLLHQVLRALFRQINLAQRGSGSSPSPRGSPRNARHKKRSEASCRSSRTPEDTDRDDNEIESTSLNTSGDLNTGSGTNNATNKGPIGKGFGSQKHGNIEGRYNVHMRMIEIYNETCVDLLSASSPRNGTSKRGAGRAELSIKFGANGPCLPDATVISIHSISKAFGIYRTGIARRAIGIHNMNEHSSRSHLVTTIEVDGPPLAKNVRRKSSSGYSSDESTGSRDGGSRGGKGRNGHCSASNRVSGTLRTRGYIHLIDLAGSERLSKTAATGTQLVEAKHINKSLSALGDVVMALANKSKHVPYRNSKLTYLLQNSLSRHSRVFVYVTVSPVRWNEGETLCSLNFAERCRSVELGAARQVILRNAADTIIHGHGTRGSTSTSSKETEEYERQIEKLNQRVENLKGRLSRRGEEKKRVTTIGQQHQQSLLQYVARNSSTTNQATTSVYIKKKHRTDIVNLKGREEGGHTHATDSTKSFDKANTNFDPLKEVHIQQGLPVSAKRSKIPRLTK